MGLVNPVSLGNSEYLASLKVSHPLSAGILNQHPQPMEQITKAQLEAKAKVRADKRQRSNTTASNLKSRLTSTAQRSMELTQEKGASCWLTALPIEQFRFHLHKRDFRDALALRYGWLPSQAPTHCACGKSFTVEHALSCPKGGFPSIRHNEVRDLTAILLTEVCHNVSIEPDLQPLTGEQLSLSLPPTVQKELVWMSQQMGSGVVAINVHCLMLRFSTLTHPHITIPHCPPCIDNRKT